MYISPVRRDEHLVLEVRGAHVLVDGGAHGLLPLLERGVHVVPVAGQGLAELAPERMPEVAPMPE